MSLLASVIYNRLILYSYQVFIHKHTVQAHRSKYNSDIQDVVSNDLTSNKLIWLQEQAFAKKKNTNTSNDDNNTVNDNGNAISNELTTMKTKVRVTTMIMLLCLMN
jgi:hypothetical protein